MMSDLILLSHTDLHPVILVLSLRTDTQLAGAYNPLDLDGFASPCHPHAVTQICHWVCLFLPLHITFEEGWGWVNLKSSWDTFLGTLFIHYLFSYIYYLNAISHICLVISCFFFFFFFKEHSQIIHTSVYSFFKLGLTVVVDQHIFIQLLLNPLNIFLYHLSLCKFSPTKVLKKNTFGELTCSIQHYIAWMYVLYQINSFQLTFCHRFPLQTEKELEALFCLNLFFPQQVFLLCISIKCFTSVNLFILFSSSFWYNMNLPCMFY